LSVFSGQFSVEAGHSNLSTRSGGFVNNWGSSLTHFWMLTMGNWRISVKLGLKAMALAALLSSTLSVSLVALAQQQQTPVPDAPAPQAPKPLTQVSGPITPGLGAGNETTPSSSPSDSPSDLNAPSSVAPSTQVKDNFQPTAPENLNPADIGTRITLNTTEVMVPVTVKDNKGKMVAGLTWRDFKVFENDTRVPIRVFSVDPYPLSMAFVIDQSLTSDVMDKVNNSLDAIQGALTPYDEIAVFSYNNGAQERTGFTGAQSSRLPAVLALTKATGSEIEAPVNSGPMAGCNIRENGACVDPNLQPGRSTGSGSGVITIPKEIHTLNDAILAAAKEMASRPKDRRRIIYVVSDGKENGSKATIKEVIHYLQTNEITVYATLVGTSAGWGEGFISRIHLPFTMYDNVLYKYIAATGGQADSERNLNGIEKSYFEIAKEARNQYTIVYASHESIYDSKYRKIDVRVTRPGLDVTAKQGYYPSALMSR
jgi:VWFA-related protein